MLALIALMLAALGLVLLILVGLIALLSLLRVQRGRTAPQASQLADYSVAIGLMAKPAPVVVTVRRPRTVRQVRGGPAVRLPLRPAPVDKVVFRISPANEDHSVQPLLDYLKAELAARATG